MDGRPRPTLSQDHSPDREDIDGDIEELWEDCFRYKQASTHQTEGRHPKRQTRILSAANQLPINFPMLCQSGNLKTKSTVLDSKLQKVQQLFLTAATHRSRRHRTSFCHWPRQMYPAFQNSSWMLLDANVKLNAKRRELIHLELSEAYKPLYSGEADLTLSALLFGDNLPSPKKSKELRDTHRLGLNTRTEDEQVDNREVSKSASQVTLLLVGGRLALFAHNWKNITSDPWMLDAIQHYHIIKFNSLLVQTSFKSCSII